MTRLLVGLAAWLGFACASATAEEAKQVTITIRVVDASCKPMSNAWVTLIPVANEDKTQTRGVDTNGVVTFEPHVVAAYRIEARAGFGGGWAPSSIGGLYIDRDYEATMTVNLAPGAKIVIVE